MWRIFLIISLTYLFNISGIIAQQRSIHLPERSYGPGKSSIDSLIRIFNKYASLQEFGNQKIKKEFISTIKNHTSELNKEYSNGQFMISDKVSLYLQKILQKIQAYNNELVSNNYLLFTGRSSVPNAYSYGQGLIIFNMPLLERMENEAEIAFIICHEIAHDYLKHLWKRVRVRSQLIHDEEFKKELKKALKQEYGSYNAVDSLLTIYVEKVMVNSRSNELQADSLGLVFYKNCGYPYNSARRVLEKLDSMDYFLFKDSILLSQIFHFSDYPFNSEWLKTKSETSWGRDKSLYEIPESLKTHPDCKIRIKKIEELKYLFENTENEFQGTDDALLANRIPSFKMIEIYIEKGKFDLALFQSLHLLKYYPEEPYLHGSVTESLYYIWHAKKKHNFYHAVHLPDEEFPAGFNLFLNYLHNINSGIVKQHIGYYFNKYLTKGYNYEYFHYLITLIKTTEANDNTQIKSLLSEHKKRYGETYYYNLMCNHFNLK